VEQRLWFGNKSSNFILTNDSEIYKDVIDDALQCKLQPLPNFSNWGLPPYLGFTRCPTPATPAEPTRPPRVYYGDVVPGDNGYWLLPDPEYKGAALLYYLAAPAKINIMGNAYIYMEISGLNNSDETIPYSNNNFTRTTNETNGVVNSAFAKIAIQATPVSQWFGGGLPNYKWYYPPAERIRKIRVRLRYHNNSLVDFGKFEYSFTLAFSLLRPQSQTAYKVSQV